MSFDHTPNISDCFVWLEKVCWQKHLRPVHTKEDNCKDNYKDNDISVHTSKQYRLFILSAHASAALNFKLLIAGLILIRC